LRYHNCEFYNKPIEERYIRMKTVLSLILVILVTMGCSGGRAKTRSDVTILEIGKEDRSYAEFANKGFRGLEEFRCSTEQVPSADAFPLGHFIEGVVTDRGVSRILFDFALDKPYDKVILRLCREGSETTVVTVDEETEYQVTSEMLGSRDGNHFGVYDLLVGPLETGRHTIVLSVLDDGKSTGGYAWDALKLLVR
jgi:hypothetical protein